MKAFLLILLTAVSLAWIAFSTYNLSLQEKLSYHPEYVFNEQDSAVLIVNRSSEIESASMFVRNEFNPFLELDLELFERGNKFYFSVKRPLLLIEKKGAWSAKEIQNLTQTLKIPKKDIYYTKGSFLCVSSEDINLNEEKSSFLQMNDKNASGNIIEFLPSKANTDIYQGTKGNFKYISKLNDVALSKGVDDKLHFSYVLPEETEDYSFFERDYLSSKDSVFAGSLMRTWVDRGIVMGSLNGGEFLITDYLPQQNPILILQEKSDKLDTNFLKNEVKSFIGFQFTKNFPREDKFYVLELEDKVVMAESKELCEKIALHFKLGKTLALNLVKQASFYSDLTKDVHYRRISKLERSSISFSEKQKFEVRTQMKQFTQQKNQINSQNVQTISVGGSVKKLKLIADHIRGEHSYFVSYDNNSYALYSKDGKLVFKGDLDNEILDVEVVDVYLNNKKQIAVLTSNSLHVLDLNGNEVNGFPYLSDNGVSTQLSAVSWRGQSKFIFGDDNGNVIMLNAKGMELYAKKLANEGLKGNVFGLNRKGTLSAWVETENSAYCAELEKSKVVEKLKSMGQLQLKNGGEIINLKALDDSSHVFLNISGEKLSEIKAAKVYTDGDYFYSEAEGYIKMYTAYGDFLKSINKSNQEISSIRSFECDGKYFTLVLDNLENNVYLFGSRGEMITSWPKEGSKLLEYVFSKESKDLKVVSVLDNNLIVYSLKI